MQTHKYFYTLFYGTAATAPSIISRQFCPCALKKIQVLLLHILLIRKSLSHDFTLSNTYTGWNSLKLTH